MVDEPLALRKIAGLRARPTRLRAVFPPDRTGYLGDESAQESVVLNLVLAIQGLVDLAAMVGADAGWPVPKTMAATIDALVQYGVIEPKLAERLGCAPSRCSFGIGARAGPSG